MEFLFKRARILIVAILTVSCPGLFVEAADERPNILFIIADDLGARLGSYDDPLARTPELDQLADQGVLFRNCFTQFATCGPSRASMLSGLYPFQTGITRNGIKPDQSKTPFTSRPELFRRNGYVTARVGKVFHMGIPGGIGEAGSDEPEAWDIAVNNTGWDGRQENYERLKKQEGATRGYGVAIAYNDPDIPAGDMADRVGTQQAIRLMAEHHPDNTGKPLMLFMGYYRPHPPMIAPRENWDLIAEGDIRLPLVPEHDRADIPDANLHLLQDSYNFIPESVGRRYTHAYYAAINFIDTEVGKLLAGLKANGLDQNTIVVFTGDQGFHLGEHGHWHKSPSLRKPAASR